MDQIISDTLAILTGVFLVGVSHALHCSSSGGRSSRYLLAGFFS